VLLKRQFTNNTHTRRLIVTSGLHGWDVIDEEDSTVLRHSRRHDWHRVERDIRLFEVIALTLERAGWVEVPPEAPTASAPADERDVPACTH
jgi:hypothetical protein